VTEDAELFAGRYRLERLLGGGSADVHQGRDTRLGRTVVVKIARAGGSDFDPARFENETLLLAGLRHPGLVTLFDAGTVGDRPYLVMQHVPGGSLAARISGGPLPPEQVRRIGAALAEALAYLHGNRVVHRDLKPGNVLLGGDGGVYLADFGIARTVDAARMTVAGLVVGTPAYLAPEQALGGEISPACDMYALGLLLLECLTGRREYSGTPIEAAVARLYRRPAIPADLPDPWPDLLGALTAENPADRPNARQVVAALSGPDGPAERTAPLLLPPAVGATAGDTAGGGAVPGAAVAAGGTGAAATGTAGGLLPGGPAAGDPAASAGPAAGGTAGGWAAAPGGTMPGGTMPGGTGPGGTGRPAPRRRRGLAVTAAGVSVAAAAVAALLLSSAWQHGDPPQGPAATSVPPAGQQADPKATGTPSAGYRTAANSAPAGRRTTTPTPSASPTGTPAQPARSAPAPGSNAPTVSTTAAPPTSTAPPTTTAPPTSTDPPATTDPPALSPTPSDGGTAAG
jgi:eukaryotic-like serine/threonine-protein kinase